MTDLFQGALLLLVGLSLFALGLAELGGFDVFVAHLPQKFMLPFADFNTPTNFNAVGDFLERCDDWNLCFLFY